MIGWFRKQHFVTWKLDSRIDRDESKASVWEFWSAKYNCCEQYASFDKKRWSKEHYDSRTTTCISQLSYNIWSQGCYFLACSNFSSFLGISAINSSFKKWSFQEWLDSFMGDGGKIWLVLQRRELRLFCWRHFCFRMGSKNARLEKWRGQSVLYQPHVNILLDWMFNMIRTYTEKYAYNFPYIVCPHHPQIFRHSTHGTTAITH